MQSCYLEPAEDMALRKEDKAWITEEIRVAIRDRLDPQGWKKLQALMPIMGVIGVFVALLALAGAGWNYAFSHVKEEAEFRTHTGDRLDAIESLLRELRASKSPGPVLREIVALDDKNFVKSLPVLQKVIEQPFSAVNATPETLREVAYRLQKTEESSGNYWPTVLQFIQFASASLIPPTDIPPANTPYTVVSNLNCTGNDTCIQTSHCAMILDGGHIPNSLFDHCRIKFTNNRVGLEGTRFIDCIFEIPTDITQPTPYLKSTAKILLASNLRQVKFPG